MHPSHLLAATLWLVPAIAAAQPVACPPGTPRIDVTVIDREPSVARNQPMAALAALSNDPGLQSLGLTTVRLEWRNEFDSRIAAGADAVCAVVGAVRITLIHAEHRILIAREIPGRGCLYQEVLEHERRHVAANRALLRTAAAAARRALTAWAATAQARAATPDQAVAQLREGMRDALAPVFAGIDEARTAAHRAIDTPEEYRRLWQSCATDQIQLQDRLRRP